MRASRSTSVSLTRREIAVLIDALRFLSAIPEKERKKHGITDKDIKVMLFKLWRVFNTFKGILC